MTAQYEVCQIRKDERIGKSRNLIEMLFIGGGPTEFKYTAYVGGKKIMESDWLEDDNVAHQQLLQHFLAEGWEPVGIDQWGKDMSLRRQITEPNITC